jgi:two-component system LytT family response regulator
MKVVLIDDEELARLELRRLLAHHSDVEIIGEADGASAGEELLKRVKPELVFLDIKMPARSGFDLLSVLPTPLPRIVFVTAYDAFALRAFDVNALDYLLKPVHPERLGQTLDRVRSGHVPGTEEEAEPPAPDPEIGGEMAFGENDPIFIREGERCWFVPLKEVRLLETEGSYTRVHFRVEAPLVYRTLAQLEARLPATLFFRANRGQLVNVTWIEGIESWFSGSLKARLRGGTEVEFSRRQAQYFRGRLSL